MNPGLSFPPPLPRMSFLEDESYPPMPGHSVLRAFSWGALIVLVIQSLLVCMQVSHVAYALYGPHDQIYTVRPPLNQVSAPQIIGVAMQAGLTLLAIAGCITMLLKQPTGRALLLIWSYISIPVTAFGTIFACLAIERSQRGYRLLQPHWYAYSRYGLIIHEMAINLILPVLFIVILNTASIKALFRRARS